MIYWKKAIDFLKKKSFFELLRIIYLLIQQYFASLQITPNARNILQELLKKLKVFEDANEVVDAMAKKIGWRHTARFLIEAKNVQAFLSNDKNAPIHTIKFAFQLPASSIKRNLRKKILFITGEFPSSLHGGGNRVLNFIKELSLSNDIYLCTIYNLNQHASILSSVEPYCVDILKIPFYQFSGNQAQILKWLNNVSIDVVHYEWPRSLENFDSNLGKIQIFTYMEAVSLRLIMDMERLSPLSDDWLLKLEQLVHALYIELVVASKVNIRVAVTEKDAKFFNDLYPYQEYIVLNHGLTFDDFELPEITPESNTLTFVGNYLHYPNAEAIDFFFTEIWDEICKRVPDARIYLVGTNPTQKMLALANSNNKIMVTGTVDDIRPYIQKASVCIAPLITGAGLRGKVIEYAALKRTFVATSIATTDLIFRDGIDYFHADIANEFASKVVELLKNKNLNNEMSKSVYQIAKQNYDTKRLTLFLLSLYEYFEKYVDKKP